MSHLRAFVANQVLLRIRVFLGLFCPDFYADIEDFTQILCRYLPKKLAAKTSGLGLIIGMDNLNQEWQVKECLGEAQGRTRRLMRWR